MGGGYSFIALFLITFSHFTRAQSCQVSNPNSALDYANCDGVGGWAFDWSNLDQPVTVDIYIDGIKTYSGITANGDRPDLSGAFGTSAARYHGFNFNFPATASWRNGQNHTVTVRICGVNGELNGSPKAINGCTGGSTNPPNPLPNPNPNTCGFTAGQFLFDWYGEQIYAQIYNGVLYASYQNGTTGFKPRSWMIATNQLTAEQANCFANADPHTTNPPTNPEPPTNPNPGSMPNFAGNLDNADCNGISGWVVNRNTQQANPTNSALAKRLRLRG